MSWWLWFVAAFGLGIIEVLAPGYIFLGFALAAAVMGLLALMGVHLSLPAAVAAMALLALAAWAALHRVFPLQAGSVKRIDRDINEN
jgi:inner membrane protein